MEKLDLFYLHQMFANFFEMQLNIFDGAVTLSNNLNEHSSTSIWSKKFDSVT